jgi:hypothetical protein
VFAVSRNGLKSGQLPNLGVALLGVWGDGVQGCREERTAAGIGTGDFPDCGDGSMTCSVGQVGSDSTGGLGRAEQRPARRVNPSSTHSKTADP